MSPLRTKTTEPASNVKAVFARWTLGTSTKSGLSVALRAGDAWDSTDEICTERPDLFSPTPLYIRRTVPVPTEVE
jgi:hypothetical protein